MIQTTAMFWVVTLVLSGCVAADSPGHAREGIRAELIAMMEEDQRYRDIEKIREMPQEEREAFMRVAAEADRSHTARLKQIVDAHGWPTRSLFGDDGTHAAFLLVQHADHDPEFQAQMLPLLEAAVDRGEVAGTDVAYLTDRVRVKQGRPQLYGTQYEIQTDESGVPILNDQGRPTYLVPVVEDIEHLDERRRAVGLGRWMDYELQMAAFHHPDRVPTPSTPLLA
jgi:hypothetical protein